MRPVVFSGFDVTDALWKYLEVGHNIDPRPVYKFIPGFEDCLDEGDDDPELAEMTRRAQYAQSCVDHFRRVRRTAPTEDRKLLEIPFTFDTTFPDSGWQPRLFVPTGGHARDRYKSGALSTPSEDDLKAIQSFIECANRLLPDDAARERGSLKLEDLQYLVCPTRELFLPVYKKAEKEELFPPRYLHAFRKEASRKSTVSCP